NDLIDRTIAKARESSRRRMNYNLHSDEADPVNRLLNAMHRGTFVPVHRHLSPALSESFVVLRGRVGVIIYDHCGQVMERRLVGVGADACGFDIEAGIWHGLVVLEDDTVLFEVKQGPYAPLSAENIAPWSPDAQDEEAVAEFVKALEQSFE
ncbi:MAG: WbuC family cupin fold metalloprotein, partial [Alistipes sp.]|nr:WbuC family cupin fold metalloprotein [Alistipes sp.]